MPDDLYWDDILTWSERQAELLRRVAAGERVNDVDWPNIIEEIESVGRSELRACASLLERAIEHLLKLHAWSGHSAAQHWRREVRGLLRDARRAFSPSMRQRLDVAALYQEARDSVADDEMDGVPPGKLPETCALTLDALLADKPDVAALLDALGHEAAD